MLKIRKTAVAFSAGPRGRQAFDHKKRGRGKRLNKLEGEA